MRECRYEADHGSRKSESDGDQVRVGKRGLRGKSVEAAGHLFNVADISEDDVTRQMSVQVVHPFEVVDVDHQQRQRDLMTMGALQFLQVSPCAPLL